MGQTASATPVEMPERLCIAGCVASIHGLTSQLLLGTVLLDDFA